MSEKDLLRDISTGIEPAEVEVGHRHRKEGGQFRSNDGAMSRDGVENSMYVGLGLMSHDTTDDAYKESVWQKDRISSRNASKKNRVQGRGDPNMPFSRDELSEEGYYFLTEEEEVSSKMYFAVVAGVFAVTIGLFSLIAWLM